MNELANSYSLSGQLQKAVPLLEMHNKLREKAGDKKNLAIGLGNIANVAQIPISDFEAAESNLRRSIDLCQEIKDEFGEAVGHQELGLLLTYSAKFSESEKELAIAYELAGKVQHKQNQGLTQAYCVIRALLMEDADKALKQALRARELADDRHYERDIIQAEWLLGAAYLAKKDLKKAEVHLHEALARDRRINLIEIEPDILLSLAKLRFTQAQKNSIVAAGLVPANSDHKGRRYINKLEEALNLAKEALEIAERCQYRLKQTDTHNFLAEFLPTCKRFSKGKSPFRNIQRKSQMRLPTRS
jgi:tetratricopeptide (TPR) repeat protein